MARGCDCNSSGSGSKSGQLPRRFFVVSYADQVGAVAEVSQLSRTLLVGVDKQVAASLAVDKLMDGIDDTH